MNIVLRILLFTLIYVIALAVIDYFFNGIAKYILWGIIGYILFQYNEKKNQEYKDNKKSKNSSNE